MTAENKSVDSYQGCYDIHTWLRIRSHYNYDDIKKLANLVEGMTKRK